MLLLGSGTRFLGRRKGSRNFGERLMARAAHRTAEVLKSQQEGGPVYPSRGAFAVRTRSLPKLPERFSREFFGASGVTREARYHTRDTGVVGVEERVEIERGAGGLRGWDGSRLRVHLVKTPFGEIL